MAVQRVAALGAIVLALAGTGCIGRHRVVTGFSPARHSEASATAGGHDTGPDRNGIATLSQSVRPTKAAAAPPQLPPSSTALKTDPQPRDRVAGTSGDWVVTAITQHPDQPGAPAGPQAVQTVRGPTPRGLNLKVIGPTVMAGLLILICLVAGTRRLLGEERQKKIDPRPARPERAAGKEARRKPEHQTHTPQDQSFANDRPDNARRRRA